MIHRSDPFQLASSRASFAVEKGKAPRVSGCWHSQSGCVSPAPEHPGSAFCDLRGHRRPAHRHDRFVVKKEARRFGDIAVDYLKGRLPNQVTLVPVPNGGCTVESTAAPRTLVLAQSIAARPNGIVLWDGLRGNKLMTPSSQGGTRDPYELFENLAITKEMPADRIVLVDDVRTRGAHLIAAKARLAEKGGDCFLAVCAGQETTWTAANLFLLRLLSLRSRLPVRRKELARPGPLPQRRSITICAGTS